MADLHKKSRSTKFAELWADATGATKLRETALRVFSVIQGEDGENGPLGAPTLTERADWPEKLAKVNDWEKRIANGTSPKIAAQLVGANLRTLQRWRKVRDDNKRQ